MNIATNTQSFFSLTLATHAVSISRHSELQSLQVSTAVVLGKCLDYEKVRYFSTASMTKQRVKHTKGDSGNLLWWVTKGLRLEMGLELSLPYCIPDRNTKSHFQLYFLFYMISYV